MSMTNILEMVATLIDEGNRAQAQTLAECLTNDELMHAVGYFEDRIDFNTPYDEARSMIVDLLPSI